jgi:hypothetical protein
MKKSITTLILLYFLRNLSYAQTVDSTTQVINFRAATSVTNNGFSFIPAFSLGKPATIFNLNINGGKRLSFEPEFRFPSLDAKL